MDCLPFERDGTLRNLPAAIPAWTQRARVDQRRRTNTLATDGKELFYVAFDDRLMAVPIGLSPGGEFPTIGTPASLFTTRVGEPCKVRAGGNNTRSRRMGSGFS